MTGRCGAVEPGEPRRSCDYQLGHDGRHHGFLMHPGFPPSDQAPGETCEHPGFEAGVDVNRFVPGRPDDPLEPDESAPAYAYSADIRVRCEVCGEQMVFFGAGLPVGMLRDRPCISPDGTELRVPLRPQSADPHQGLGLPGFSARIQEGGRGSLN